MLVIVPVAVRGTVGVSEGKENAMCNWQLLSGKCMTGTVSIMVIFSIQNARDVENLIF